MIAHGINAADVKKLQDVGIYTCNGLMMHTKKTGSSIGLVKSMQPAISNPASADSMIRSKTDPNLCFAMHAHSSISFSGLSVESSVADHQDWCFSNGSHGRVASIVS
ncbi:unnamed protein product [Camellia sinensis]